MSRWGVCVWLAACALAACPAGARADTAVWSAAGKQVLRLRDAGGATGQKRAETLDERLTNILSKGGPPLHADDVKMVVDRAGVRILVRGDLLVTVTPQDAEANRTRPAALGKTWLANLRKTLPEVTPRVNPGGA